MNSVHRQISSPHRSSQKFGCGAIHLHLFKIHISLYSVNLEVLPNKYIVECTFLVRNLPYAEEKNVDNCARWDSIDKKWEKVGDFTREVAG